MPSPTVKIPHRTPSPRMVKAAKLMADAHALGLPKSQGEILAEAGYGRQVQLKPSKVTRSEAYLALLEKQLPPERVAEAQNALVLAGELKHRDYPIPKGLNASQVKIEALQAKEDIQSIPGAVYRRYKVLNVPFVGTVLRVYYIMPDYKARSHGLDQMNKIRGTYAPTQQNNVNVNWSLTDLRKMEEELENVVDVQGTPAPSEPS